MHGKVIIINTKNCGGEQEGRKLIEVLLKKVLANLKKPDVIIFYNSAVELLVEKSELLLILEALQTSGVELIACGMCTDEVCQNQSLLVGRITSMDEIVSILMNSQTVITI